MFGAVELSLKRETIARLKISELLALRVDSVKAHCHACGHSWVAIIDVLPDETTFEQIRSLMLCADCGGAEIDIDPIWQAAPPTVQ